MKFFLVESNGRFGIPLGEDDEHGVIEFRGELPRGGTVVEVHNLVEKKNGGMSVASKWKPSQEWVLASEAEAASMGQDATKPVLKLMDLELLDVEAQHQLKPKAKLYEGKTYVRVSQIPDLVSHYEFMTTDAEREWLAAHIREGNNPSTYEGKPIRYRAEIVQPFIEAFGEEYIVQALKDKAAAARVDLQATTENAQEAQRLLEQTHNKLQQAQAELDEAQREQREWESRLAILDREAKALEQEKAQILKTIADREARLGQLDGVLRGLEEEERERRARILAKNKDLENQYGQLLKKVEDAKRRARLEHDEQDARVPALRELSELVDEKSTLEALAEQLKGRIGFEDLVGLHVAMKLFPFVVLTGPSGSGKSSLLHNYGEALGFYTELIPVQPNWASVADLHGYVFPLGEERHYITTPFSRALGMQVEEEEFLSLAILDEINLAHVEYYLADYLSAFERDRSVDLASPLEIKNAQVPRWLKAFNGRIRVPETFLMAGTANEDHTTRAFSDKFRDRMASLEIIPDELKFGDTLAAEDKSASAAIGRVTPATWRRWRESPTPAGHNNMGKAFSVANNILGVLRNAGLEFGRRQFRDVEQFVLAADSLLALKEDKAEARAKRACDIALEMRLLQKTAPLLEPLREQDARKYDDVLAGIEKALERQKKHFPRVDRWVNNMKARA